MSEKCTATNFHLCNFENCALAKEGKCDLRQQPIAPEPTEQVAAEKHCPDCGGSHPKGECFYEDDFQPVKSVAAEIADMPDGEFKANCEKLKAGLMNGKADTSLMYNHGYTYGFINGAAAQSKRDIEKVKALKHFELTLNTEWFLDRAKVIAALEKAKIQEG